MILSRPDPRRAAERRPTSFRLDPEIVDQLETLSKAMAVSRSGVIRRALGTLIDVKAGDLKLVNRDGQQVVLW